MAFLDDINSDICFLSETWLKSEKCSTTSIIQDYSFNIVHNIRVSGNGGGTALILKDTGLPYRKCNTGVFSTFEITKIQLVCHSKIIFFCLYRPPGFGSVFLNFIQEFSNFISEIVSSPFPFLIGGDFNIPVMIDITLTVKHFLI